MIGIKVADQIDNLLLRPANALSGHMQIIEADYSLVGNIKGFEHFGVNILGWKLFNHVSRLISTSNLSI